MLLTTLLWTTVGLENDKYYSLLGVYSCVSAVGLFLSALPIAVAIVVDIHESFRSILNRGGSCEPLPLLRNHRNMWVVDESRLAWNFVVLGELRPPSLDSHERESDSSYFEKLGFSCRSYISTPSSSSRSSLAAAQSRNYGTESPTSTTD